MQTSKTFTISGQPLTMTLEKGTRYIASRPFVERGRRIYPVTINVKETNARALVIENLSYDQANELINAFNNGRTSFDGRMWR